VRDAIGAGEVERAAGVLGRPHALSGVVEHGDARGRTIGFPTANLGGVGEMLPAYGVYAVRVREGEGESGTGTGTGTGMSGGAWGGVMNLGVRPTVDGTSLRVEVNVFDFDGDLYGARLRVELVGRLRGEQKFAGIEELRAQIARDAASARETLARLSAVVGRR
jgi:riboflavin kinase/FMN adenylyltransferase